MVNYCKKLKFSLATKFFYFLNFFVKLLKLTHANESSFRPAKILYIGEEFRESE